MLYLVHSICTKTSAKVTSYGLTRDYVQEMAISWQGSVARHINLPKKKCVVFTLKFSYSLNKTKYNVLISEL